MKRPSFTTRRLDLAPVTDADLDAVWAIWREPEVRRYLFDEQPVTRERAAGILAATHASDDAKTGLWAVRRRSEAAIVGTVGLLRAAVTAPHDPEFLGSLEVLAAFTPATWGSGYATEALGPIIAHAFGTLGVVRLVASVDVPNEASHRMIRRLGFTATGECAGPRSPLRTYILTPDRAAVRAS